MVEARTQHPNPIELRAFAEGRLSNEDTDLIADHVESCDECAAAVDVCSRDSSSLVFQFERSGCRPPRAAGDSSFSLPDSELTDFNSGLELQEVIGSGGMGVVYRAWQPAMNRHVAVKQLHRFARHDDSGAAEEVTGFRREIQGLGRVRHPHLVRIYSSGVSDDGWLFYAMELIKGADLSVVHRFMSDGGDRNARSTSWSQSVRMACNADAIETDIPESQDDIVAVVDIVRQIASAAQCLHDAGIVHRDIKPSNIRINPDGNHATLMDLGLAGLAGDEQRSRLTQTGHVAGTLPYVSPEQFRGAQPAPADDIYNLGVVLWELLTRKHLFDIGDVASDAALVERILTQDPPAIREFNEYVSEDLEAVVRKCLAKDRMDRYLSMADAIADLDRAANGEPVHAARKKRIRQFQQLLRRRKGFIAAVGGMLLLQVLLFPVANRLFFNSTASGPLPETAIRFADTGDGNLRPVAARNLRIGELSYDADILYNQDAFNGSTRMGDIRREDIPDALNAFKDALDNQAENVSCPATIYLLDISALKPNPPDGWFQSSGRLMYRQGSWKLSVELLSVDAEPNVRPDVGFVRFLIASPVKEAKEDGAIPSPGELQLIPVVRSLSKGAVPVEGASTEATHDGRGLGAPFPSFPETHSATLKDCFVSDSAPPVSLHYDFGRRYPIDRIRFWNFRGYTYADRGNGYGVKSMRVFGSDDPAAFDDAEHSSWRLFTNIVGSQAPALGATPSPHGEEHPIPGATARFVRLQIDSTLGAPGVGIAEVQFLKSNTNR